MTICGAHLARRLPPSGRERREKILARGAKSLGAGLAAGIPGEEDQVSSHFTLSYVRGKAADPGRGAEGPRNLRGYGR